jgi:hypothetical protein
MSSHPIIVPRTKPGRVLRGTVFAVGAFALAGIGSGRIVFTVIAVAAWAAAVAVWPQNH